VVSENRYVITDSRYMIVKALAEQWFGQYVSPASWYYELI
jgi:hypothetical protein